MLIKYSWGHIILNHVFTLSTSGIKNAQTNTYLDLRIKFLDYEHCIGYLSCMKNYL